MALKKNTGGLVYSSGHGRGNSGGNSGDVHTQFFQVTS